MERPRPRVVHDDERPSGDTLVAILDCSIDVAPVGMEQRGRGVRIDAVLGEQSLRRVEHDVLLGGLFGSADRLEETGVLDDVTGFGGTGDDERIVVQCGLDLAEGGLGPGLAGEGRGITGKRRERGDEMSEGCVGVTLIECQPAELYQARRPGRKASAHRRGHAA